MESKWPAVSLPNRPMSTRLFFRPLSTPAAPLAAVICNIKASVVDMKRNPWIQFLYRVCLFGSIGAALGLLLLGALVGFFLAPAVYETTGAGIGAGLTGVFLAFAAWRESVSARSLDRSSS